MLQARACAAVPRVSAAAAPCRCRMLCSAAPTHELVSDLPRFDGRKLTAELFKQHVRGPARRPATPPLSAIASADAPLLGFSSF